MTSENSITSDSPRPLLNLLEKINLKKSDKYVALSNLTYTVHGKIHTKIMNLKYQHQRGIINLNYLTDHIVSRIFKTILSISSKKMKH